MGLETKFDYIDDLNTANPNGDPDTLAQADDHLRGIKSATKGSFPNLGQAAVTKTAAEINDLVDKSTAQTITGAKTFDSFVGTGSLAGNATTATNFNSSRTFNATGGDVTGSASSSGGNYTVNLQIGAGKVGANELAANSVNFNSEIVPYNTDSSFSVSTSGIVLPKGCYNIGYLSGTTGSTVISLQVYAGSSGWVTVKSYSGTGSETNGINTQAFSNGTATRLISSGITFSIPYRRIF